MTFASFAWIWLNFFCSLVLAQSIDEGPRFGPEFTFPQRFHVETRSLYFDHLKLHLVDNQPEGDKFELNDESFALMSPNGWAFQVTDDPGVIEITMLPMVAGDFKKYASDMHDAIFVSAYNKGLFPALYLGGGHINLELRYFDDKPLLLRNFLVDFLNHNELSMGVWNYDTKNALPWQLSSEAIEKILKVIEQFDESRPNDISFLLRHILSLLRNSGDTYDLLWQMPIEYYGGRSKYWALNFSDLDSRDDRRIEIRSVRPQADFHTWVRQVTLIRDRLRYLQTFKKPIAYKPIVPIKPGPANHFKLDPPVDPEVAMKAYYIYVSEAGHSWADHRSYLWPKWTLPLEGEARSALDRFESSAWFLGREAARRQSKVVRVRPKKCQDWLTLGPLFPNTSP